MWVWEAESTGGDCKPYFSDGVAQGYCDYWFVIVKAKVSNKCGITEDHIGLAPGLTSSNGDYILRRSNVNKYELVNKKRNSYRSLNSTKKDKIDIKVYDIL